MNRTLKIIFIIVAAGVILAGVIGIIVWATQRNSDDTNTQLSATNTNTPANTNAAVLPNNNVSTNGTDQQPTNTTLAPSAATSTPRDTALRTARLFTERYGSFSKNNNYENVKNLLTLMTDRFRAASEKTIAAVEPPKPDDEFYGISTRVLSVAMEEYAEDEKAVVKLQTQRSETKGVSDPTSFTQNVRVILFDIDGVWKVDSVSWE